MMEIKSEENKKIVCAYVFKDSIKRVYDCFRTPEIFNQVLIYADKIVVENGKFYSEVGTSLKFWWNNIFHVHFEIKESYDSEFYKKFIFYTKKVEPFNMKYYVIFHFYWNSVEKSTLFLHEMCFDDEESMKMINKNHDRQEKFEMFQKMEKILTTHIDDLLQFESTVIMRDFKEVWDVVSDWNRFIKLVPMIADKVYYEGDVKQIGSEIHLEDSNKKIEYKFKIINYSEDFNSGKNKLILFCNTEKPYCPSQELHIEVVRISENQTFLSFKHEFKEFVKFELINSISDNKIQILSNLKKALEKKEI